MRDVRDVVTVRADDVDAKILRHLGSDAAVLRFLDDNGVSVEFAAAAEHALDLVGPFAGAVMARPSTEQDAPPTSDH